VWKTLGSLVTAAGLGVGVGVLWGVVGGCASSPRFTPADRAAVVAVLENQQAAWNRGDLPGYMDGYARGPELIFTSGGHIRRGWDEAFARYRQRYGEDRSGMGQLAFDILGVQPIGAAGAVVLGRWRLSDTPSAGAGVFSVILERRAEGWRIIHDHTSSDPNP
jgi:ketosteroid isomerase-like protein